MAIVVTVDGVDILTITNLQMQVLAYSYPKTALKNQLINHIKNSVSSRFNDAKNDLQNDWLPKIRERYDTMPTKDADLAALIFSQPDYKDYEGRNA